MMFVGDKGKILGGFRAENSQLIPESRMRAYRTANDLPESAPRQRGGPQGGDARNAAWIAAFKGGPASYGDFQLARPISDAVNLAAISLGAGGPRPLFGSRGGKNPEMARGKPVPTRDYRP